MLNNTGGSVKLRISNNHGKEMAATNGNVITASMADYIGDLLRRDLVSNEVAEAIILKHHLTFQMESYQHEDKNTDKINFIQAEKDKVYGQYVELLQKYEALEAELALLKSAAEKEGETKSVGEYEYLVTENQRLSFENKELKDIQSNLEFEKRSLLRKGSETEKASKRREEILVAQVSSLRENLVEVRNQYNDRKSKLLRFKEVMDESNAMTKEVYVWVGELQREFLRVNYELTQAKLRLEKTKKHLSYRLGGVLVENSSSLKGVLSIPSKLLSQKREFANDQKNQKPQNHSNTGTYVAIHGGINYMYARTRWGGLKVDIAGNGAALELSLFTPSANREVSLEIYCPTPGAVFLQSKDGKSNISVGEEPLTLDMLSDGSSRILNLAPQQGKVQFFLRRSAGISSIVKLNLKSLSQKLVDVPLLQSVNAEAGGFVSSVYLKPDLALNGFVEPKPMKSAIIWQSYQLMQEGKADEAIAYAKKYARDFIKPAINLLIATKEKDNEALWLSSVNNYLSQFDIAPISLRPGTEDRFLRIISQSGGNYDSGPLISVIMPAFNAGKTIAHSIQSILSQTWRNLELFVIDDASEDNTWQLIQQFASKDTRVKAFKNVKNVGPYVSKNLALQLCKGEYITGHDADDWAHPDRLARQITELLNSHGHLKGNMARMIRMQSDGAFVHYAKEGKTSDDGVLRDAAISCMFEREYFNRHLGHWDCVRFGADSELISRAQKIMQDRFVKVRHMTMICLDNEGSLTNDPVHGVSKVTGISPTRKFYRDQWTTWHATIDPTDAVLPFPYHKNRKFLVPEAASVLTSDIMTNIKSMGL